MRRTRALGLLLLCSCGALSGLDDLYVDDALPAGEDGGASATEDGGATPDRDAAPNVLDDAGAPVEDAGDDAPPIVGPEPTCPVDDALGSPLDPRWALRGDATLTLNGGVQLTPDTPSSAGALFWNVPLPFARFDATVTFRINAANAVVPGDGVGFAWLDTSGVPASLSGSGASHGLTGLKGLAVVLDTFRNNEQGDPPAPFVVVRRVDAMTSIKASRRIPRIVDGLPHTLRAFVKDNAITVLVDGTVEIASEPLGVGAPSAFTGLFALMASTGGLHAAHYATNVTVRAGTTGECAVIE
ncbi:MAG: hypothetical protein KF764_27880 [Labilithrix sp.]|nr:hypothetical protein [Labilithrix sp.]MBX3223887.1 hypothetical protein [Labilithrix sp.]